MLTGNINLIEELNLGSLPQAKQKVLLDKMGEIINQKITIRILAELSEEEKAEFDTLLGTVDSESNEVLDFLKSKIPNLDAIAEEEVNKFKQESVDFMKSITG